MINGELIVDNFAGGDGTLQSARTVCSGKDAEHHKGQDRIREKWTVSICVRRNNCMRERPILFNTEMVKAILDGRKTCTRRVVKGYIPKDAEFGYTTFTPKGAISCRGMFETGYPGYGEKFIKLPYRRGAILYVRETWHKYTKRIGKGKSCCLAEFYGYKASVANSEDAEEPWKPSIRMPKEAARIWLKGTDVRVERLHNITEDGAKAEGAIDNRGFIHSPENEYDRIHTAREHFIKIWNSTIKKSDLDRYGWDANPYVWVISFERCEKLEE